MHYRLNLNWELAMKVISIVTVMYTVLLTNACCAMTDFKLFPDLLEFLVTDRYCDNPRTHYFSSNVSPANGGTLLHRAAAKGDVTLVESLLAQGASINTQDYKGRTPLHEAVRNRNIKAVKLLLCYGANSMLQDNLGNTLLDNGDASSKVDALIVRYQQLYIDAQKNPLEAFKEAIEQGYLNLVKILISRGVPVTLAHLQLAKKSCEKAEHKSVYRAIGRLLIDYLRLTGDLKALKQIPIRRPIYYFFSSVWRPSNKTYAQRPIAQSGIQATGLTKDLADYIARMVVNAD